MKEVVTLQIGQCGNQIGHEFWKSILREHEIDENGICYAEATRTNREDIFFSTSNSNRLVPRCVMADLEPRVIENVCSSQYGKIYNPGNIFLANDGSGAGNNWAVGYSRGSMIKDDLIDLIDHEVDNTDRMQAFMLLHSIAGGTGSGLGSLLMEGLRDRYPKTMITTISVFPNSSEMSDVVVQPYNSILTMSRLQEYSNLSLVLDNSHINSLAAYNRKIGDPNFIHANHLIASVLALLTSPLRFCGLLDSDLESILTAVSPFQECHFISSSIYPITTPDEIADIKVENFTAKNSVFDILKRLLQIKSNLAHRDDSIKRCNLSLYTILTGKVDTSEIGRSLLRVRERKLANFINWGPACIQVNIVKRSNDVNGLMLHNSTGITSTLKKMLEQYDRLRKRNAFLDIYRRESMFTESLEEFDRSRYKEKIFKFKLIRDVTQKVVQSYEKCEGVGLFD